METDPIWFYSDAIKAFVVFVLMILDVLHIFSPCGNRIKRRMQYMILPAALLTIATMFGYHGMVFHNIPVFWTLSSVSLCILGFAGLDAAYGIAIAHYMAVGFSKKVPKNWYAIYFSMGLMYCIVHAITTPLVIYYNDTTPGAVQDLFSLLLFLGVSIVTVYRMWNLMKTVKRIQLKSPNSTHTPSTNTSVKPSKSEPPTTSIKKDQICLQINGINARNSRESKISGRCPKSRSGSVSSPKGTTRIPLVSPVNKVSTPVSATKVPNNDHPNTQHNEAQPLHRNKFPSRPSVTKGKSPPQEAENPKRRKKSNKLKTVYRSLRNVLIIGILFTIPGTIYLMLSFMYLLTAEDKDNEKITAETNRKWTLFLDLGLYTVVLMLIFVVYYSRVKIRPSWDNLWKKLNFSTLVSSRSKTTTQNGRNSITAARNSIARGSITRGSFMKARTTRADSKSI
ncbi:hypothetical protein AAMO2058_000333200 [Amorphochlora amoebiformis]